MVRAMGMAVLGCAALLALPAVAPQAGAQTLRMRELDGAKRETMLRQVSELAIGQDVAVIPLHMQKNVWRCGRGCGMTRGWMSRRGRRMCSRSKGRVFFL